MQETRLIEIELHSYCNRKCSWCPNREISRTELKWLSMKVFWKLVDEIKDYKGAITFSRYNEPLSQDIEEHLQFIKDKVDCKLVTNTNGDFINNIPKLLDEITIMNYDNLPAEQCISKLISMGCNIDEITEDYIYASRFEQKFCYVIRWPGRTITDRGGFMKEYSKEVRTTPCMEPTYFVGINYDGTVSPCCNIRNDIEEHKPYILGDLNNSNSLKQILNSPKAVLFKENCANGIFEKGSPCYTCSNSGGRYTRGNGGIKYE
jgi:MoaA/NifB/PqqE/SkfB family radical SAM enzyme